MPLSPGPWTFSTFRLEQVLQRMDKTQFQSSIYETSPHILINSCGGTQKPTRQTLLHLVDRLYKCTGYPKRHLRKLDVLWNGTYDPVMRLPLEAETTVIKDTANDLRRLPEFAPSLSGLLGHAETAEVVEHLRPFSIARSRILEVSQGEDVSTAWSKLQVSNFVNVTVLRVAIRHNRPYRSGTTKVSEIEEDNFLNMHLTVLKIAIARLGRPELDGACRARWFVVCAFLWTSWQRIVLLQLLASVTHPERRILHEKHSFGKRESLSSVPELYALMRSVQAVQVRDTPYLCPWAFSSLQNNRDCFTMDFRGFVAIYRTLFGDRGGLCISSSHSQCDGSSSYACDRFNHVERAVNQTAHARNCHGQCARMFWDEISFRGVSGSRAVNLTTSAAGVLKYCSASEETLTISHVWAHGQGGRPEKGSSGFNTCLHERYSRLARQLGCDSYWIDTACIPSEPKLRWECIEQITSVFTQSKCTLIVDRDFATLDASKPRSIGLYEAMLVILLVCDWNLRAWTLLESQQGRKDLRILVGDESMIPVAEVFHAVKTNGSLDILSLALARRYLLFQEKEAPEELETWLREAMYEPTEDDVLQSQGFLTIDESLRFLSRRHPTRESDQVLVWSLMVGRAQYDSPDQFWKAQRGKSISLGAILTSAPRLPASDNPGFSWAPSSPTGVINLVQDRKRGGRSSRHREFRSLEMRTMSGEITAHGLSSWWLVVDTPVFQNDQFKIDPELQPSRKAIFKRLISIEARFRFLLDSGGNKAEMTYNTNRKDIEFGLLVPSYADYSTKHIPLPHSDCVDGGYLMVVVFRDRKSASRIVHKNDQARSKTFPPECCWTWLSLYEWAPDVALPKVKSSRILLE